MWVLSIAATSIITSTIVLTVCRQKAKHQKRLAVVSDAGYETAHDVHYPLKYKKPETNAGPVLGYLLWLSNFNYMAI